eukprot:12363116-Karenia_brevis.AAC.1
MIIASHVDDLKGGATKYWYHKLCAHLESKLGKLTRKENHFEHCGIMHEQRADMSIFTHQQHYVRELKTIDLTHYKGKSPHTQLDEHHSSLYCSLVGALAWLLQVYIEIAVYVHALQRHLKKPLLEHATRANRVVLWA